MSAFIVSEEHIRYLVWARHNLAVLDRWDVPSLEEMESDAVMLYNANLESVNYRYADENNPPVTEFNIGGPLQATVPQVFKAIHCLDYQACEPPAWTGSPAEKWLRDLAWQYESHVEGYDGAAWEIPERPTPPARVLRLV